MKNRWYTVILPIVTLVLEALPYGAVLRFANPEGEPWRETFSYFSLTPFGYANFAPFITAIATCIVFLLLVLYCATGKLRWVKTAQNFLWGCAAVSFGPLLYGLPFYSAVGFLISLSLIAELLLLRRLLREAAAPQLKTES